MAHSQMAMLGAISLSMSAFYRVGRGAASR
jgi:hypothetical protein